MNDKEFQSLPVDKKIEIDHSTYGKLVAVIDQFAAFDGIEFANRLKDYHRVYNREQREAYMCEVLSHVTLIGTDVRVALTNIATINEYCESWQVLEGLFNATLAHNKIDHEFVGDRDRSEWEVAGAHLAQGFFSAGIRVMGALNYAAELDAANKVETKVANKE